MMGPSITSMRNLINVDMLDCETIIYKKEFSSKPHDVEQVREARRALVIYQALYEKLCREEVMSKEQILN